MISATLVTKIFSTPLASGHLSNRGSVWWSGGGKVCQEGNAGKQIYIQTKN